jgi:RND family efflux transporter MFP subunit
MKKTWTIYGWVLLLLTLFALSCRGPKKELPAAENTFGATPVKVVKVARQKISEKISYTGTIEAWRKIDIIPEVGGKIARIPVNEGDRVAKGQLIAELETETTRLQLQQAEAGLAVAQASYKDALKNKERMERLLKENAVSSQQQEQVQLGYEAAQAQLQQAQAGVNLARHALDISLMRAPFSGVIASKNAEVGDVINPMMGSFSPASGVLTLVDFSKVKLSLAVSQNDILRVKKDQAALLRIAALPGREFEGKVTVVNQAADPTIKKFGVEVLIDNPDSALRPGTFGEVLLEVSTHENALACPQKAIIENKYVFLALGRKAQKREVVLGLQNSDSAEILSGLNEGDEVVVEGNYGLEDGAEIEIH